MYSARLRESFLGIMTVGDVEETHESSATALATDDAGLADVSNIWSLLKNVSETYSTRQCRDILSLTKAPVCNGLEIKPETDKIGLSPPRD